MRIPRRLVYPSNMATVRSSVHTLLGASATVTKTAPQNSRFNDKNNRPSGAFFTLIHFFVDLCKTTTWSNSRFCGEHGAMTVNFLSSSLLQCKFSLAWPSSAHKLPNQISINPAPSGRVCVRPRAHPHYTAFYRVFKCCGGKWGRRFQFLRNFVKVYHSTFKVAVTLPHSSANFCLTLENKRKFKEWILRATGFWSGNN